MNRRREEETRIRSRVQANSFPVCHSIAIDWRPMRGSPNKHTASGGANGRMKSPLIFPCENGVDGIKR